MVHWPAGKHCKSLSVLPVQPLFYESCMSLCSTQCTRENFWEITSWRCASTAPSFSALHGFSTATWSVTSRLAALGKHRAHTQTPHTKCTQNAKEVTAAELDVQAQVCMAGDHTCTRWHLAYFMIIAILERPAQCDAAPIFWREAGHNLCHTSHKGCQAQLLGLAKGWAFQMFSGNSRWLRPLGHIPTLRLHVMKCTDSSVCSQGATASDLALEDAFAYFSHCCRKHTITAASRYVKTISEGWY